MSRIVTVVLLHLSAPEASSKCVFGGDALSPPNMSLPAGSAPSVPDLVDRLTQWAHAITEAGQASGDAGGVSRSDSQQLAPALAAALSVVQSSTGERGQLLSLLPPLRRCVSTLCRTHFPPRPGSEDAVALLRACFRIIRVCAYEAWGLSSTAHDSSPSGSMKRRRPSTDVGTASSEAKGDEGRAAVVAPGRVPLVPMVCAACREVFQTFHRMTTAAHSGPNPQLEAFHALVADLYDLLFKLRKAPTALLLEKAPQGGGHGPVLELRQAIGEELGRMAHVAHVNMSLMNLVWSWLLALIVADQAGRTSAVSQRTGGLDNVVGIAVAACLVQIQTAVCQLLCIPSPPNADTGAHARTGRVESVNESSSACPRVHRALWLLWLRQGSAHGSATVRVSRSVRMIRFLSMYLARLLRIHPSVYDTTPAGATFTQRLVRRLMLLLVVANLGGDALDTCTLADVASRIRTAQPEFVKYVVPCVHSLLQRWMMAPSCPRDQLLSALLIEPHATHACVHCAGSVQQRSAIALQSYCERQARLSTVLRLLQGPNLANEHLRLGRWWRKYCTGTTTFDTRDALLQHGFATSIIFLGCCKLLKVSAQHVYVQCLEPR